MPPLQPTATSSAANFTHTIVLFTALVIVWTVGDVRGKISLTMESFPEQPAAGEVETGEPVSLTCKGLLPPSLTSLSFSIVHACAPLAAVVSEDIACYARDQQCEGFTSAYSYHDNGSLIITVAIDHFRCHLRGTWTCTATFRSSSIHVGVELKSSLTFLGFSWPSDISLTSGNEVAKGDSMLAAMAGSRVIFTCIGNVGSTGAYFFFTSSAYSENSITTTTTGETLESNVFNASKETDYKQADCLWLREATLEHTVTERDDRMTFKCGVTDNHHSKIFTNSVTTLFVVNASGTTWRVVGHPFNDVTSALTSVQASTGFQHDCLDDVWLIFAMTAGGILTVIIIIESVHHVHKKTRKGLYDIYS